MLIRAMSKEDIPQVAAFEAEIAAISFGSEAVTNPLEHIPKITRALAKGRDIMMVLSEAEKVMGWLWISINTNMFTGDLYANFRSFALHPQIRGSEYGQQLFAAGLEKVTKVGGVSKVVGKVHVDNIPMRLLYKQLGFAPVHLTMELSLSDKSTNMRNET